MTIRHGCFIICITVIPQLLISLIIGSKAQRENLSSKLNTLGLNPSQEGRNLGVIFGSYFDLKAHVWVVTKTKSKKHFIIEKDLQSEAISRSEQHRETDFFALLACLQKNKFATIN